jgi:T-complex protein 1 subunit gamma
MLNKDVTHSNMRRRIENPRIVLLDCPLEYKKGESQTNAEIVDENHWNRLLEIEEEQIKEMCEKIISVKPDLLFTEKGVSGFIL